MWRLRVFMLVLGLFMVASVSMAQDSASDLPLLPSGLHVGVVFVPSEDTTVQARLDTALMEVVQAGSSAYEFALSWADLEKSPGQIDTSALESLLDILVLLKLQPYLSITTINTVKLTLPSDLMTADGYALSQGRQFDDPVILERFARLLDALVPLMIEHNGFFISVGNEVDGWLESRPEATPGYVRFSAAARDYAHQIDPRLGIGSTLTFGAVQRGWDSIDDLLAASDAAVFTYYPLEGNFDVRAPEVVTDDLALMMEAAGDMPVLFQEVGYPSGYLPSPTNSSSVEKQREFYERFFNEVRAYPQVRFISGFMLSDWTTEVCDLYVLYYTNQDSLPLFHEYLCSLGIMGSDGIPKPAYDAFLGAIRGIAQERSLGASN